MAALTQNAIFVTVRDRVIRTKIWDHKGYKSQIRDIFLKIQNLKKSNQNGRLDQKCYLCNGER